MKIRPDIQKIIRSVLVFLICLTLTPELYLSARPYHYQSIPLWKEKGHGKAKVSLSAYIPKDGNDAKKAVIICPGGSYFWLDKENEGEKMAENLCRKGIAAFVLTYRVAGGFNFVTDFRFLYGGNVFPAMLEDARCAISEVRGNAASYGINPKAVGIMGFSAGGHLAMLTAEMKSEHTPDFVAAIYPVVTMSDKKCVHRRSRRGIMGTRAGDRQLQNLLSMEKNVPHDCCPVFLLSCEDDKVVDCRNAVLLDSALTERRAPHKYISLPCGGHGFGVKTVGKGADSFDWTASFADWTVSLYGY